MIMIVGWDDILLFIKKKKKILCTKLMRVIDLRLQTEHNRLYKS